MLIRKLKVVYSTNRFYGDLFRSIIPRNKVIPDKRSWGNSLDEDRKEITKIKTNKQKSLPAVPWMIAQTSPLLQVTVEV